MLMCFFLGPLMSVSSAQPTLLQFLNCKANITYRAICENLRLGLSQTRTLLCKVTGENK